jgi:hypothetical protein
MANAVTQAREGKSPESSLVRLNVNLNAETAEALKAVAADKNISVTEAVRRAIAVYKFIAEENQRGRHIQTTDPEREQVRELILM